METCRYSMNLKIWYWTSLFEGDFILNSEKDFASRKFDGHDVLLDVQWNPRHQQIVMYDYLALT